MTPPHSRSFHPLRYPLLTGWFDHSRTDWEVARLQNSVSHPMAVITEEFQFLLDRFTTSSFVSQIYQRMNHFFNATFFISYFAKYRDEYEDEPLRERSRPLLSSILLYRCPVLSSKSDCAPMPFESWFRMSRKRLTIRLSTNPHPASSSLVDDSKQHRK